MHGFYLITFEYNIFQVGQVIEQYLAYKLIYWDQFSLGMAPILIGFFFFASVQLFFIGVLGEYIANIHTQIQNRPMVVESERINFKTSAHR